MSWKKIYEKKYKTLLIIPFALLILALLQLGVQQVTTGDFINKGVTLKGGSTVTLPYNNFDIDLVEQSLMKKFPSYEISLRTLTGGGTISSISVDSNVQEESKIGSIVKELTILTNTKPGQMSVEIMGASLGESFFKQTFIALLVAFALMGCVVFFYFRSIAPSLAVMLAALSDIIVTLSIFNLTGMKLSSAGIAAFLMLIGYSVDTDILLSTRVLKRREGTVMERIFGAMTTGLTMTFTTLIALLVALFMVQSEVVKQIMLILFIGLLVDLVMTWIQNVGILRWYLEKKGKHT